MSIQFANKKKSVAWLVGSATLVALSGTAQGQVLVDTGTPSGNTGTSVCNTIVGWRCTQAAAVKIDLLQETKITDIKSYFFSNSQPGDITIALYNNVNNIPGQELYSSVLMVPGYDWYGLSNLSWDVTAGSYWVAFMVKDGQTYHGALGTYAPIQLEYANSGNAGETWYNLGTSQSLAVGLIVEGVQTTPVPEPASSALFFAALGLSGFLVRRSK